MRLVVRTAGPPAPHIAAIRGAVLQVDPGLPLFDVQTLAEHRAFSFFVFELAATLLGAFGLVAALLAGLGLYGVIAQSVAQRTREIGVRMSLGATAGDIRSLVVKQGATLAALGVAAGLAVAVPITRLFAPQLLGVGPLDPMSYGLTGLALAALAAAACYVPARRAARLDPGTGPAQGVAGLDDTCRQGRSWSAITRDVGPLPIALTTSVLARSSPLNRSGSPRVTASAYAKQSP